MTNPKVSVIIPVYRTERYLKACLDSVKKQTLQDIEIILVDDGSPDGCPAICDAAEKEDARIRVIHKENAGLGMARNSGIEAAKGEYIGFVDSDDYIAPEMFETLFRAAKEHDAELVVSGICFVDGNMFGKVGARQEKSYFEKKTLFEVENGVKQLLLGVVGALPHEADDCRYGASVCKNLFKREVIETHHLRFLSEREILSEDTLFMVDFLLCTTKAVGIPGAFYCYRRNGESLSKSYNSQRFPKSMIFLKALQDRISPHIPEEEYGLYLDRLTQGFGRVLCAQEIMHARQEHIPYSELRKRLKAICTQQEIQTVLKHYPWQKLPTKQAVFAFLMKHRLYLLQKWIVVLRDR